MASVYVSSTFSDLKDHREQVRLALRRMGHLDIAMEYYGAADERPLERCLRDVESCDLYVGIFAWRYGFIPDGHDRSITELEFLKAVEGGKDCLIFLVAEDAPWPFNQIERAAIDRIEAFRNEVKAKYVVDYFSSQEDLKTLVSQAVSNWEKRRGIGGKPESADWQEYKRALHVAHQYVRLAVIAGARQKQIAHIPLTEVFIPQMTKQGRPNYEVPEEVLQFKRELFTYDRQADALEEPSAQEADFEERVENLGELSGLSPEPILDAVARERTQVILGGPGSGKSTLMHYALLISCDSQNSGDTLPNYLQNAPVPFLIELRQYALKQSPDFISYIITNAKDRYDMTIGAESLKSLLREDRRALVIFDGLDEVFDPAERANVIEKFASFARQFPLAQIIVTSRIVGYDATDLGVAGFQHYTLLDFNILQIRNFVPRWYRFYTWEGDERDAQGLIQRIIESPRLLELAGNPLLLTMMAVIYKHQDLPEQRWKLYERCTEVLLEDWDIKRKSIDLKTSLPLDINIRAPQKAEILQRVSMYMLEHGQQGRELNAIAYQPLMNILAGYLEEKYGKPPGEAAAIAEGILNHLRERTYILAEIGEGIFGFVHRTFMEYFAAAYCKAEFNARKADYEWLKKEIFNNFWQKDEWEEVLLLLIAMLCDQGSPIQEVIDYLRSKREDEIPFNIAFAAQCLAELGAIEDQAYAEGLLIELVEEITEYLIRTRKDKSAPFTDIGLKAFSKLAPLVSVPPAAKKKISDLKKSGTMRLRMVAWQMGLAERSREERLDYALAALRNKEEAVRRGAMAVLEREWPGKAEVGRALVEVVRFDRHTRVRQAAIEALQRAWPEEDGVLEAIGSRIDHEPAYTFVTWICGYLADNWLGSPDAFAILQKLAFSIDNSVARAAVNALLRGWRNRPETLQILQGHALNGKYYNVQVTAIRAIAQGWRDNPDSLPLVRKIAKYDVMPIVRIMALEAIAGFDYVGYYLSDTYGGKLLKKYIEIGGGWRTHPETLPLMIDRASNDNDLDVRNTAIQLIAQGWPDDSRALTFLRDLAAGDKDPDIRGTAVVVLKRFFRVYL